MSDAERENQLARAEAGAQVLYRLGARRVWLFGSLAQGHPQDGHSDLDFAVSGLSPARLDEARRAVRRVTRRASDVIALEASPPDIRGAAMRSRQLLQPRPPNGHTTSDPFAGEKRPRPTTHYQWRLDAVLAVLMAEEVRSVLDLGCGDGRLLAAVMVAGHCLRLGGVDLDDDALAITRGRLGGAKATGGVRPVIELWHGLLTHRDDRLLGYEAATAIEVIEHLEPPQLAAFTGIVFGYARSRIVIVTTPNAEYNVRWRIHGRRHVDHRFEWDRSTFAAWAGASGDRWGYTASFSGIGPYDPKLGHPTQMAVFRRSRRDVSG
jgi:predicted nucleotidyltransferase/SAM-dependent methyltransferase